MAIVIKDRVKQISLTTGSGAIALSGSFGGFTTFSAIGNNNQTFYGIENESRYEVGIGTYNSNTLTRDTVLSSSNGGSKINLDGVSTVFCTYPAGHAVYTNTSGFLDLSDNSGIILPGSASFNNLTVSGDITVQPYADKMTTFIRTSSGNFFQAYVDDAYDRTVALYTDATSSPQWRLGVKDNPAFVNQPPTYAYVYGEDGDVGIVADATCSISLKHSTGFTLTHKGVSLIEASKTTGVSIDAPDAGATLVLEGSGYMSRLGTVDVQFGDGTIQTTAFLGLEPVSGIAVYSSGQVDQVASDLLVVSGIANAHTTDYAVDILANTASGTAISGWANATFSTSDTDTTYTGGSGITLQGGVFHATNTFASNILANTASGVANSGYFQTVISALPVDTDTTYTAGSGLTLVGTEFNWTESGVPIANSGYFQTVINALSTNTDYNPQIVANSASGVAISGWALSTINAQDHSAASVSGWASSTFVTTDTNTTYTDGSGITLQGGAFHATNSFAADILAVQTSGSAGDTAVSGWVVAQGYLTSDSDTTYTAGSGMELVGTVFHWTESGVPIANSGYAEQVYLKTHPTISAASSVNNAGRTYIQDITLDSNGHITAITSATETVVNTDTDTTYTAGSGMELVGTVFHWTESGVPIANSGYFEQKLTSIPDHYVMASGLSGTAYNTYREIFNVTKSNSIITGGEITDGGAGTIDISAGSVLIRSSDNEIGELFVSDFSAVTGQALTDGVINYIYVEYNAGSPQITISTSQLSDVNSNLIIGAVVRDGTTVHITNIDVASAQVNQQVVRRFVFTDGLKRQSGSITSEVGTRNIAVTEGLWWLGLDTYTLTALDTSAAGTFTYVYQDGIGGWTEVTSSTQIDNTQYDDGTGTLATISNNKYGVHWVYCELDYDYVVVYGRGDYSLTGAEAATPPSSLPSHMNNFHTALVAKIIIQKNASSFYSVQNPFVTLFGSTSATSHSSLSDLTNDDHSQYMLTDGSRTLTGPLLVNTPLYASGLIATSGGVTLPNVVPGNTTNKLYNNAGTLSWNGSVVNTTYTAGSGLTLVGTEFNTQGSGNFEGLIVEKAIKSSINIEADGATITYDMNDSNTHMSELGGNRTIVFDNAASGQKFMCRLKQDGTGSRTVTWPANIKWENGTAPTLSSAADHADWIGFICTTPAYYDGAMLMSGVR